MKKIYNFVKDFIIIVYILVIIFVTICLLSYNDYGLTVLDGNTWIPVIDEDLEPNYTVGDLLIVEKNKLSNIREGDTVFFYRTVSGEVTINFAKITSVEYVSQDEYTFTVEGDYKFSSDNLIGKVDTAKVIPKIGAILGVLESKYGFLFLGVFPSLIAFLYTLYTLILEVQVPEDETNSENEKKNKKSKKTKIKNEENENKEEIILKEDNIEKIDDNDKNIKIESDEIEKKEEIDQEQNQEEDKEDKKEIKEENQKITEEQNNIKNESNVKNEKIENKKKTNNSKIQTEEEKRKSLIEAKIKSMTEEEKRALIKAKLDSMTDEEKKALLEAKRKKLEAEKNNK